MILSDFIRLLSPGWTTRLATSAGFRGQRKGKNTLFKGGQEKFNWPKNNEKETPMKDAANLDTLNFGLKGDADWL